MDPTTALSYIYEAAKAIYSYVELVKSNKSQCKSLADRVRIITAALDKLDKQEDLNNYLPALLELLACLNEMSELLQEFTNAKGYMKFIKAKSYNPKFDAFNNQLERAINQLNLGLNAQQVINRDQDKKDQQKDQEALKGQFNDVFQLVKQDIQDHQQFQGAVQDKQELLTRQMEAVQKMLEVSMLDKPAKPLPIDAHFVASWADIRCRRQVGEGSFGKVYEAEWKGQTVAVKLIGGLTDPKSNLEFIREVKIMSRLHAPHVPSFFAACFEEGQACILMEFMGKGSLDNVLSKQVLTPEQQKSIALSVARGLYFLHEQKIIHRDLKSANILLDNSMNAKVSDFGLSQTQMASVTSVKNRSEAVAWMAPESVSAQGTHSIQSDTYSYGVILWEIVTGKKPYAGKSDAAIIKAIQAGELLPIPSDVPKVYQDIIRACWNKDPALRIKLPDIIAALVAYDCTLSSPDPEALCNQGMEYEKQKDFVRAFECYFQSAQLGYFRAQTNLAGLLLTGPSGIPKDKPQAYNWLVKAAAQGHVRAMENLAKMLKTGDGIPKDEAQAALWQQRAKDAGSQPPAPLKKAEPQPK